MLETLNTVQFLIVGYPDWILYRVGTDTNHSRDAAVALSEYDELIEDNEVLQHLHDLNGRHLGNVAIRRPTELDCAAACAAASAILKRN